MTESKTVIETTKFPSNSNEENWRKIVQAIVVCAQRGDIFRHNGSLSEVTTQQEWDMHRTNRILDANGIQTGVTQKDALYPQPAPLVLIQNPIATQRAENEVNSNQNKTSSWAFFGGRTFVRVRPKFPKIQEKCG